VATAMVIVSAALVLHTISTATRLYLKTEKNLVINWTGAVCFKNVSGF
jgi:hypothetical protein